MEFSRRTFLKGTLLGGAGLSILGFDLTPAYAQTQELKISHASETRSTCPYCSVSCGVIIYTLGGPCAFCTFQTITGLLHWWLTILHDYVLRDYSLAIMMLVVCMRFILHPVTRYAQLSMQRFSKQMQSLQPKQKKLQYEHQCREPLCP